ncbi:ferritin-like domain-containing protein [Actinomadura sp. NPDC047616]|uniref:ferritin-like domain-containing protein n=1 Tax=Actinomadura sp. NPDC047616 TaxID=3155914 RepID=UPI0033E0C977
MSRSVDALQEALKAEHAAVYGYGVVGARLRGALRRSATAHWDAHRLQRDRLMARISQRGARPVAAAPAYRLPVRVTSARTAAELAAALEDGVVTAYAGLAGAPEAALRTLAARAMQEAVARSVRWRNGAGLPRANGAAFPGLPPSALTPRQRPGAEPG